ncbi:hypothetical protein SNE32_15420, partial [Lysobacter sp. D1-1-M9]|uniref:hypothetical protein n=1 Tax=Novilysobacter longmucuonensis TaxID=3098603 RepID=UPI002FCAF6F3
MNARMPGVGLHATALLTFLFAPVAGAQSPHGPAGFVDVDPETLEDTAYYDTKRFPGMGNSAFHPDAHLVAPVRAMLLVDAEETEVRHARYRIRYDLLPPTADGDGPTAHVEVARFNLGPAIRAELATQDPALPLAPLEAFGTGPHVVYRFTMAPIQGMQASVREAGRHELNETEASAMSCLDQPCLDPAALAGPEGDWRTLDPEMPPLSFHADDNGPTSPAAVTAALHHALGEDVELPVPR